MNLSGMTHHERKASLCLASIFAMRMLGLFMVLPVLAIYGTELIGATPALIGLAIGAYGFTQACLQIPFGMWSDRLGRKPVIIIGLLLFIAGSVLAAMANDIYQVILGRCLQGAGAIASTIMAMAADLTREEQRTKAMAMIGISIGLAFCLAMVLGPLVTDIYSLSGLFYLTAALSVVALALVWILPTPIEQKRHREANTVLGQIGQVIRNGSLLRLDIGVFALHFVLMGAFVVVPVILEEQAGLSRHQHWWVYLITLVLSFIAMVPFIIVAEAKRKMKEIKLGAIVLLAVAVILLYFNQQSVVGLMVSLFVFFMAFNWLEASLPSLVSKIAPAGSRGTAMGVFSTSQFLGAAIGASTSGWVYQTWGMLGLTLLAVSILVLWWVASVTMQQPPYLNSIMLDLTKVDKVSPIDLSNTLAAVKGVEDVVVIPEEHAAYLKVDKKALDTQALQAYGFGV